MSILLFLISCMTALQLKSQAQVAANFDKNLGLSSGLCVSQKTMGGELSLEQNISVLKKFSASIDNGFGLFDKKPRSGATNGIETLFQQVIPAILTKDFLANLKG